METDNLEDLSQRTVNDAVSERYAEGANAVVPELCCPVSYDGRYLEILPEEIIDRDYGCGDPSQFVAEGETVLDLGSGGGKICYMASQIVGPKGKVIGVDMTPDMLELSRKYQQQMADKIGWHNTTFFRGQIENLKLDLDQLDNWLGDNKVEGVESMQGMQAEINRLEQESPMIADNSVDVVVSNCVLNLVAPDLKQKLFEEIYRVLKPGGRAVISDIVSSERVPEHLQKDSELWSGCISGAFEEVDFLNAFADVGFVGVKSEIRQSEAWQVVEDIEFRSMTVIAYRPHEAPCCSAGGDVIYKGPFEAVSDESGTIFARGEKVAVSASQLETMSSSPYKQYFDCFDGKGEEIASQESQGGCC
ncbi:MAG: methyltransferase domain-containing protein [Planctomycetota bacterium]|jgi:ubiquinone/menaquinone biosynthesis C-methylase UbiE|nr:methyltransferase domain-containing protein [Planctomycetota bacterium]